MKYLKAEAEVIKFDNSDVVMASYGLDDCAETAKNEYQTCDWPGFFVWLFLCFLAPLFRLGYNSNGQKDAGSFNADPSGDLGAGADWL